MSNQSVTTIPRSAAEPVRVTGPQKPDLRLTWRATLTGLFFAIIVAVWVPYCNYIMQGPRLTLSHMSAAALILFFFTIFCVQLPLQRWRPASAFSASELVVIFSMMLMASTIPGKAFVDYFLGLVATPYYYASPENRWTEVFFAYLPNWLLVSDPDAAQAFYEGVGQNPISWGPWIIPMFWWLNMLAALFLTTTCITVIFRKQWIEHERLTFPLVRIPMELIEKTGRGAGMPDFMRGRPFWLGFGVTLAVLLWNCISYFNVLPPIPVGTNFRSQLILDPAFPPITMQLNIFAMCFAFFAELNVLFSIWVFYLFAVLEIGFLNQLGLSASGGAGGASWAVKSQHFGGFWLFVLWGFWIARHHLKNVFLNAFGRHSGLDDSDELFSYRAAVIGLIAGLVYTGFWLSTTGMTFGVVGLFLLITLLLYIGVARIVAETGLVFLDLPVNSNEFTVVAVGSNNLSPANLTALGLGHAISHNHRGIGMSSLLHSLRVADGFLHAKRGLFGVIAIALLLTFIVTIAYVVQAGSTGIGAHSIAAMNVSSFYNQIVTWLNNPAALTHVELYFLGIGGLVTAGLIFMHYRFPWWPLHPIGYTVAYADIIVIEIVSIFFVWLIKGILLKLGGIELYRKAQPAVIGVLLGYAAGVAVSFFVDMIWFPGAGHQVHNW